MNTSRSLLRQFDLRRGLVFGVIIVTALLSFEIFNYSTTEFALSDLLGDLEFAGLRWATILAIAFCGIDFAGIARLFTPSLNSPGSGSGANESWYLFGAWLLAATMNAMLTWWGTSLAVLGHQTLGNEILSRETMMRVVPMFVAVLVWLIRVLIIGAFSVAGDRLFIQDELQVVARPQLRPQPRPLASAVPTRAPALRPANSSSVIRAASRQGNSAPTNVYSGARQEPTYHSISANPAKTTAPHPGNGPRR